MSFGAVAAIGGAVIAADAAGNAADAQKDAANQTNATNRAVSRQQMELQEPFREAGVLGNNRLMHLLGLQSEGDTAALSSAFDSIYRQERAAADAAHRASRGFGFDDAPAWAQAELSAWDEQIRAEAKKRAQQQVKANSGGSTPTDGDYGSLLKKFGMEDFQADPGYQFRMDEGMRGVEGSAAARGGLLSGAAQKAIQKYGQGLASQEYGNAYSRFENDKTNTHNKLLSLIQAGQGSANQMTNTAGQFAQNNASALGAYGNASAAGSIGTANAWGNGLGQAANIYQENQLIKQNQANFDRQNELYRMIRNPGAGSGSSWYTGNSGMAD